MNFIKYINQIRILLFGIIACYVFSVESDAQVEFSYQSIDNYIGHTMIDDIDGDGKNDLILHEHADPYHIKVEGRKTRISWFKYPEYTNYTIAFGDFMGDRFAVEDINSDGSQDVVSAVALDSDYEGPKEVYWYENPVSEESPVENQNWKGHMIGNHTGAVKDIKAGDIDGNGKPDIVIRSHEFTSIFFQLDKSWAYKKISHQRKEGLDIEDLDLDGDLDLIMNGFWFEAPANPIEEDFIFHNIDDKWYTQNTGGWQDNNCYIGSADLNQDGIPDIILSHSEKTGYPLSWYSVSSLDKVLTGPWEEHHIVEVFDWCETVDIGDVDNDGTLDVMAAKFRRHDKTGQGSFNLPPYPISLFYNKSGDASTWTRQDIDEEGIYAGSFGDLGSDGDLDIVGPLSYFTAPLRIWENKTSDHKLANVRRVEWSHLTSQESEIPLPNVGRQAAALAVDIDKNGSEDIVVAGWSSPSMVWLRKTEKGWDRYVIDDSDSHIEAGGDVYDIDGDGDLDILQGGSWATNEVWWWENPYPVFEPKTAWKRHTIKNTGEKQHHDQIFIDLDGDKKAELVFWNQMARKLSYAKIPSDPTNQEKWKFNTIWTWPQEFKYEGLAKADVDLDGLEDLIGGGQWFKYEGKNKFKANEIDDYGSSRSAAADLIEGGHPEVVLGSGDDIGPLNLYEWDGNKWLKTTLIAVVDHGHTLQVGDINGDGHQDIYTAEMYRPGSGDKCRQWVLYGNGKGQFDIQVISVGIGTHEGKLGDLDGDGDLDILQKDFQETRRVDVWFNTGVK